MKTVSLAWRNLLRNRRRSLTTLTAMVVGLVTVLMFGGYTRNITYSLQTGYVMRSGHLQIQHKGYYLYGSGNPAGFSIADYPRVIDLVSRDPVLAPMVTVVTPMLSVGGIAGHAGAGVSHTVLGTGVVVEDHNRMRQWDQYGLTFREPPSALTGTTADAVVIGTGVARVLQLCAPLAVPNCAVQPTAAKPSGEAAPDDIMALARQEASAPPDAHAARLELLVANVHGAPNVAALLVIKAEQQGFKEFDDVHVGMHLVC